MKTSGLLWFEIITIVAILGYSAIMTSQAADGDIIILRDVPSQRFDVNRHTGRATSINPSPVNETNAIKEMLGGSQLGITELTDMQSSTITSNRGIPSYTSPTVGIHSEMMNQISSGNARSSLAGEMGSLQGMTSGIGRSVGSSVSDATRSSTNAIRDVLTGTNFGN